MLSLAVFYDFIKNHEASPGNKSAERESAAPALSDDISPASDVSTENVPPLSSVQSRDVLPLSDVPTDVAKHTDEQTAEINGRGGVPGMSPC